MKSEVENYPLLVLCQVMRVSTSGYYDWFNRKPSARAEENNGLRSEIANIFSVHKGRYGRRRIAAELNSYREKKLSIGRVTRRMKEISVAGIQPKSFKRTTIGDPLLEDSPNLVALIDAKSINEIWVSDITYIRTKQGWLYLCTVIDLYSRKVVGWSMRSDMKAHIVIDALNMAVGSRTPSRGQVVFHSDKGGQYKAKKLRRRLEILGIDQSMTGVNHCYDNANAESFFGTLKRELIGELIFSDRRQAEDAIFEYIEVYYNRIRRHSSLEYDSPYDFESRSAV